MKTYLSSRKNISLTNLYFVNNLVSISLIRSCLVMDKIHHVPLYRLPNIVHVRININHNNMCNMVRSHLNGTEIRHWKPYGYVNIENVSIWCFYTLAMLCLVMERVFLCSIILMCVGMRILTSQNLPILSCLFWTILCFLMFDMKLWSFFGWRLL